MEQTFATYAFYDKKSRQRLAIFASVATDVLSIAVIPCSVNDQFSRRVAKELYAKDDMPKIAVPIVDNKPVKTLFQWAKENYVKKQTIIIPEKAIEVIRKDDKVLISYFY